AALAVARRAAAPELLHGTEPPPARGPRRGSGGAGGVHRVSPAVLARLGAGPAGDPRRLRRTLHGRRIPRARPRPAPPPARDGGRSGGSEVRFGPRVHPEGDLSLHDLSPR